MTVSIGLAVTDAASPQNEVVSYMQNAFELWIGQQVIVQVAFGQIKVSLRGMLLQDQAESLLMRPEAGSEVKIAKTRILAIEEVGRCSCSFL